MKRRALPDDSGLTSWCTDAHWLLHKLPGIPYTFPLTCPKHAAHENGMCTRASFTKLTPPQYDRPDSVKQKRVWVQRMHASQVTSWATARNTRFSEASCVTRVLHSSYTDKT
eukprot:2135026-Amphidinium_carterae.1